MEFGKKIEICKECEGQGRTHYMPSPIEYENGEQGGWSTCWHCKGTGRMVVTTDVSYEPFDPDKVY